MINQNVYGFSGAFAVSGQYGSNYWGCRPSDSYGTQLSALFGNPYSGGCRSFGGYHGYGMSGCFGQNWSSALGNSCNNYFNCMPNYGGQAFGCYPPSMGYGGCCGFPQPCQPCPCPPPCKPSCTEQTHKMWDVWFDTEQGQETVRESPIVLDLNGNGKADITGKNILGDGQIDGPTTMFDMNPDKVSYQFKSYDRRPGLNAPEVAGGYWVDAEGKKRNGEAPPSGWKAGETHAGWKYMDPSGKVVGELDNEGLYYYGAQEKREKTEWLAKNGGDGLLVADYNKDGQINDATELFGTEGPNGQKFKNGYEKLAALHDTNKDGKISGKELEALQIWKDSNADGVVQKGELLSLASQGITSFDVKNYNGETMEGSYKTTTSTTAKKSSLPYMSFGAVGAGFGGVYASSGFSGAFAGAGFGGAYAGAYAGFGFGGAYASTGFGGFSPYFNSFVPSFGFSAPWMGSYG